MTEFTASNGIPVIKKEWGYCLTTGMDLGVMTGVSNSQFDALREYFQAERDKETPYSVVEGAFTIARFFERELAEAFVRKMGHGHMVITPEEKRSHPWEGSPVGSVWKIVAASPGHHALIWLSNYQTWDILGPKGESFVGSEDPIVTLTENGYPGFEDYQSAKELKET